MHRTLACILTAALAGIGACANTTLLPPEMETDCDDVADSEMCSDDGSEPSTPMMPVDRIKPIVLECDEDGSLSGTGPFEIVASVAYLDEIVIAADGSVFGTGTIDAVGEQAVRVVDGEAQPLGDDLGRVVGLTIDGSNVIVTSSNDVATAILRVDRETEASTLLARQGTTPGVLSSVAVKDDAIYWLHSGGSWYDEDPAPTTLWRNPRVPEASVSLGELDGDGYDGLVVLNNDLYLLGDVGENDVQSLRVANDVSSDGTIDMIPLPPYADLISSDGQDLFFMTFGPNVPADAVLGELSIMRVDGVTLEATTLYEAGEERVGGLVAGGGYVYWESSRFVSDEELVAELWRASSDGRGAPQRIATLDHGPNSLAEHDGALYWISSCLSSSELRSHIVKTTD